ncbi:MAG TPA: vitamin B12 dependent-methionine synthase activation domain-containing protein [Elusimicrobiales bacterium]|nr:vitamin B12 dependent-methionine synthase activation domain-containing protein [Elusimicrobiales bacterium]HOL62218.1 vitamin B12 dependent-methionine synthase activation domain-containing protein [Elusimicrobiales bacterium]HPO94865.1 vitamin B12 dependent-methionine synthase activation domain-containing protein [Elusimicrobiales bacterium]
MEKNLKPDYKLKNPNLTRRKFEDYDIEKIFEAINYDMLYFRFFNLKKSQKDKLVKLENQISEIKKEIIEQKSIIPKGVSKVFKASSISNFIIIKDDEGNEIERIETKQNSKGICLADFIGEEDYVGFSSVSVFLNERVFENLLSNKDFSKLYIINSIAVMSAEAFCEILHKQVNVDFGIDNSLNLNSVFSNGSGKRFSPGYPSIDISANKKIYDLLNAKEIGSSITESFMIEPESSVQSIILHNPKSDY